MSKSNKTGTARWNHFESAVEYSVQRSAHKWTFEQFEECFPLYAEEDRNGAKAAYRTVSDYIENETTKNLKKTLATYDAQKGIDRLHRILLDAEARQKHGEEPRKDIYQADLDPRTAVCARTVPLLEKEAERLRAEIAALEEENLHSFAEIEENVRRTEENQIYSEALLDKLDSVLQTIDGLPMDKIEEWAIQTQESLPPIRL